MKVVDLPPAARARRLAVAFGLLGAGILLADAYGAEGRVSRVDAAWIAGRMGLWMLVYPLALAPLRRRFASRPPAFGWATTLTVGAIAVGWSLAMEGVVQGVAFAAAGELREWARAFFSGQRPIGLFLPVLLVQGAAYAELTLLAGAWERRAALRAQQVEAHRRAARLQLLRHQLHPHFLFNALHGVVALLREQPAQAAALLGSLQSLYRASLRSLDRGFHPLADEIAWVRRYLEIERTRFSDRLSVRLDVAPDAAECQVPPLILQPLVENAIRHGVARNPGPVWIAVSARRRGADVVVAVGNRAAAASAVEPGFGLRHTRRRLAETYGEAAALTLAQEADAFEAVLRLPVAGAQAAAS